MATKTITTNKKGMTLVELLVYMVLAAFLLAPIVMLVQNSSISMARDSVNANLRMSGRELLSLMYNDLKNTGYKLGGGGTLVEGVSITDLTAFENACKDPATGNKKPDGTATTYGNCPANYDNYTGDLSSFTIAHATTMAGGSPVDDPYHDILTVTMSDLSGNINRIIYEVDNAGSLIRTITPPTSGAKTTIARNVAALKFLCSDNLKDWKANPSGDYKNYVQYIKVVIVLRDPKRLSPVNNQIITVVDNVSDITDNKIELHAENQAIYERHEIVIPIPNNGLFP